MTLLEWATCVKNKISTRLAEINAALVTKGQTECADMKEVPAKIKAIETGKPDILSLVSGITKYTDTLVVDGEERSNVLVQPSDFSDESKVTWSDTNYFVYSIEEVEGSENGVAAVISPKNTASYSSYAHVLWYDSANLDSTASDAKTYLVAFRAKASSAVTDYLPQIAFHYRPTGSTTSRTLYYSYLPTTEWKIFYAIINLPSGHYFKDITMCYCARNITHYIDWITMYDITGNQFSNTTFGARATAYGSDVRTGKSYYKDGILYTGTMPDGSLASPNMYYDSNYPGFVTAYSNVSTAGYMAIPSSSDDKSGYTARYSVANLAKENIKSGVTILGVEGELEEGITPTYTNTGGTYYIEPGESFGLSADTYLEGSLNVVANNNHGYAGAYNSVECIDRSDIQFIIDGNGDNLMGWMVIVENGIGSAPDSSSRENILSIIYRGSNTYTVQSIDSESGMWTTLTDDSLVHYFVDDTIYIACESDSIYRFIVNKTYHFFPFYSSGSNDLIVEVT